MKRIIKHLKENWISHLFETLVVVVGILMAFTLNNWNERRKQEILEIQYLERLVADLAKDTVYYNQRINYAKLAKSELNTFIHEVYEIQESFDDAKKLIGHLFVNTDHLTTNNSAFRELSSTGNLSIFRNQELKESISDYYRLNEELASNIQEFNLVSTQYLVEMSRVVRNFSKFLEHMPYDNPKMFLEGEWEFLNDPSSEKFQSLESMASMYWFRFYEHLDHFQNLKSSSSDLISQIHLELDVRK